MALEWLGAGGWRYGFRSSRYRVIVETVTQDPASSLEKVLRELLKTIQEVVKNNEDEQNCNIKGFDVKCLVLAVL